MKESDSWFRSVHFLLCSSLLWCEVVTLGPSVLAAASIRNHHLEVLCVACWGRRCDRRRRRRSLRPCASRARLTWQDEWFRPSPCHGLQFFYGSFGDFGFQDGFRALIAMSQSQGPAPDALHPNPYGAPPGAPPPGYELKLPP